MSLAKKLREQAIRIGVRSDFISADSSALHDEAADALDAKDAEIARLREALGEALDGWETELSWSTCSGASDPPELIAELRKLVKP